MPTNKEKWIGVLIMLSGLVVCSFFIWLFQLDGAAIDLKNPLLVLKFFFITLCLIVGLYLGLHFTSGKKVANEIGGALALFLALSFLIGFVRA